ncbi:hypothetical protein ACP4OV_010099 [Aristida adscensionis]
MAPQMAVLTMMLLVLLVFSANPKASSWSKADGKSSSPAAAVAAATRRVPRARAPRRCCTRGRACRISA